MSDLFGGTLPHDRLRREPYARNELGVLASSPRLAQAASSNRPRFSSYAHAELARALRAARIPDELLRDSGFISAKDGGSSATDIARDLSGRPLTASFLSRILHDAVQVEAYSAPESSAVRYLQSTAVRLELHYAGDQSMVDALLMPRSVFFKRSVMRELGHAAGKASLAPQKLLRDVMSHEVEAAFLASSACSIASSVARVPIPFAYHVEHSIDCEVPFNSCFATFLQDFSPLQGWHQLGELPAAPMAAALAALAKMHAFFWACDIEEQEHRYLSAAALTELKNSVWSHATYWSLDRQPLKQLEELDSNWRATRNRFERELRAAPVPRNVSAGSLYDASERIGERLANLAHNLDAQVHGTKPGSSFRTLIHGDPKAANLFFRDSSVGLREFEYEDEVGMIDFQWSGFGLCAVDVVYVIASSCAIEGLDLEGEKERGMLRDYHRVLVQALVEFGVAESADHAESVVAPLDSLFELYRVCFLDFARIVFAYHWPRIEASPEVLASRRGMLGSNTYNKSTPHAVWFVQRTVAYLEGYASS